MEKSDLSAIRARFQTGATMEGSGAPRLKSPVQPTLSGPVGYKRPGVESGNSTPKPSYLKNTRSDLPFKSPTENLKARELASKFENPSTNSTEEAKPPFAKPFKHKPPESNHDGDAVKPLFPKPPFQKPATGGPALETKPTFPKPPPTQVKPFLNAKVEKNESAPTSNAPTNLPIGAAHLKAIPPKPNNAFSAIKQQTKDTKEDEPGVKPFSGQTKSSFRAAQNRFLKADETVKEDVKPGPASGPIVPKKPTIPDDPNAPKKNPLPNIFALGSPPSKPNRPPRVNIEKFKKATAPQEEKPELPKESRPEPPVSHPGIPSAPILPPRPGPGQINPTEEEYDDVGQSHGDESGEDMYEDLDSCAAEAREQEKKREKEEKRRAEQEKKEQKEREKKEQEARKKYKLSGVLRAIHKGKARVDCKGGKNELNLKQGDSIEIIRVTDNPEGRWLARSQDGSFGYVKTESVEIDFVSLKNQGRLPVDNDGDLYDDVGSQEEAGRGNTVPGVVLPPPPDGDVYDDVEDSSLNISSPEFKLPSKPRSFLRKIKSSPDRRKLLINTIEVPPPAQFGQDGHAAPADQELYDDVASFPPPPPISSMPRPKSDGKTEDPKKQKKLEKEEKEFRKKFKFDGEITVLYKVTVVNNKKGSGKDLAVQAGEMLDVISNADPDKLICRNKEGRYGYVLSSNIKSEDNDIYDDIGDDSIYDND